MHGTELLLWHHLWICSVCIQTEIWVKLSSGRTEERAESSSFLESFIVLVMRTLGRQALKRGGLKLFGKYPTIASSSRAVLLVGCLTSQQHVSVSQGRIRLTSQQRASVSQGRICLDKIHAKPQFFGKDPTMVPSNRAALLFCCLTSKQHADVSQGRICLTSQQHAGVFQGRICLTSQQIAYLRDGTVSTRSVCCHTKTDIVDQTCHLTQSQCTDTGPTSPRTDR